MAHLCQTHATLLKLCVILVGTVHNWWFHMNRILMETTVYMQQMQELAYTKIEKSNFVLCCNALNNPFPDKQIKTETK